MFDLEILCGVGESFVCLPTHFQEVKDACSVGYSFEIGGKKVIVCCTNGFWDRY